MSAPTTLPVEIYGAAEDSGHEALQKSMHAVGQYLNTGGRNIHLVGRVDGPSGLRGSDLHNVYTLARLFLSEHPDYLAERGPVPRMDHEVPEGL